MSEALLEPIAAGQTRFRMQGLQPDPRGIGVGRETLMVVPSLGALVAFLGAYSDEASLDDLLPTMTIEQARRVGGGHGVLVRCNSGDGYAVDRLARLVRGARGQLYTGGGRTFVRWREREAPFGYDLAEPVTGSGDDVVVVDVDYAAHYQTTHRMDPVDLIQRLQLQVVPLPLGAVSRDPEMAGLKEMALVLVAPALATRVLRYLWRLEVTMAGYYVTLEGDSQPSLLLRLRQPRARVVDVLHQIPGIELLAPVSTRAAVQIGFRHPIQLASAQGCLPGEEMFLFRGSTGRVERLDGPPRFVDGRHLVESAAPEPLREVSQVREAELEPLRVTLTLRPTAGAREPRAVLVSWDQARLLRHLIYLLPPSALAVARLVPLVEGLLVLAQGAPVDRSSGSAGRIGAGMLVPLGRRLVEVAPGMLAPDGHELWPRVRPALLRQLLGLGADDYAIYLALGQAPRRIRPEQQVPLDAALVARLAPEDAVLAVMDEPALGPAVLSHERLGRFALWGFGGLPAGGPRPAGDRDGS